MKTNIIFLAIASAASSQLGVAQTNQAGGGVVSPTDVTNTPGFKKKVKLGSCSCGSFENPGSINSNHEALDKLGIKNVGYVSPNTRHEFQTWRRSLRGLAPLLFR